MADTTFNGIRLAKAIVTRLERRMAIAMGKVANHARQLLKTGQPIRTYVVKRRNSPHFGAHRIVGLNPSAPGEPPHSLSGDLRRSIHHRTMASSTAVVGVVAAGMIYARVQEKGHTYSTMFGRPRRWTLAARPYLSRALVEKFQEVAQILRFGLKAPSNYAVPQGPNFGRIAERRAAVRGRRKAATAARRSAGTGRRRDKHGRFIKA